MATKPAVYADSCCFIDLAKSKVGKTLPPGRDKTLWAVRRLLDACHDGVVDLFVSTISIAECTHAGDTPPDTAVQELFFGMLSSGQFTRLVQPTVFVCERARDLLWKHGMNLSGADAIHIASAIEAGCTEFITTDARRNSPLRHAAKLKEEFSLRVIRPPDTDALPEEYRQEHFPAITVTPRPRRIAARAKPRRSRGKR